MKGHDPGAQEQKVKSGGFKQYMCSGGVKVKTGWERKGLGVRQWGKRSVKRSEQTVFDHIHSVTLTDE